MARSTFAQPLPPELQPLMSAGYETGTGKAKPFEVLEPAPAGALAATAADMAHFMIAHLQNGKYENAQILSPETAQQMHARQPGFNPDLNAMALGFYQENRNGHSIIGHGGDTFYFHSDLHLILDAGVGFYVSYNSAGKGEISPRTALWHHFLDRYFAYTPPDPAKVAGAVADAQSVSGYYMTSRRSDTNFLKASEPFGELQVIAQGDGTIKVVPLDDFNGQTKQWREIAPMVYRDINGQDRIAFQKDASGRRVLQVNFPAIIFQRVSWLNSKPFNIFVLVYCLGVLLLVLILWPVAALVRRHYRWRLEFNDEQRRRRRAIRLVCLVDVIFVIAVLLTLTLSGAPLLLSGKLDPWFFLFQVIGVMGALGTLVVIYSTVRSWADSSLWIGTKLINLLVMLACIGFTWFLIHWDLINFNLNY